MGKISPTPQPTKYHHVSLTAILLILTAACTHVGWNVLGKRRHPNLAFFTFACATGMILLLPALYWNRALWALMPTQVGLLLLLTGFWQALYIGGLSFAYKHGHLSVAYPLARALPVLLVTLLSVFRTDGTLSPALFGGGALIIGGAILLPLPRFGAWDWHHYRNLSCMFALVAALGTTGYSVTDDLALQCFRDATADTITPLRVTLFYFCLEGPATIIWLLPTVLLNKQHRRDGATILRNHMKTLLLTGIFMSSGYFLILLSMAYVDDVSYVVAFRQLSIPLGAIVAILFLKEPAHRPKLVGIGLMFAGLLLTALG